MSEKITVDFTAKEGLIRKELYGSGLHIFVANRHISDNSEIFKSLRFPIVRNHDWSLNNPNQRMIDVHHIFPLMHLDPADEKNYVFAPSDIQQPVLAFGNLGEHAHLGGVFQIGRAHV